MREINKEHVFSPGSIICPSPTEFSLGEALEKGIESASKPFVAEVVEIYRAPEGFPPEYRTLVLGNDKERGAYLVIVSIGSLAMLCKHVQEELENHSCKESAKNGN